MPFKFRIKTTYRIPKEKYYNKVVRGQSFRYILKNSCWDEFRRTSIRIFVVKPLPITRKTPEEISPFVSE